jgi:hypothetical protein
MPGRLLSFARIHLPHLVQAAVAELKAAKERAAEQAEAMAKAQAELKTAKSQACPLLDILMLQPAQHLRACSSEPLC